MAHYLEINEGGSAVAVLSGNTAYMLTEYTPQSPEKRSQGRVGLTDGGEIDMPLYENPTETIEVSVLGASTTAVQSNLGAIEKALYSAKLRQMLRAGNKVYLYYQVDGDSTLYRSEILDGRLEIITGGMAIWGNKHLPVRIHITRRYYWEAVTATELQLSSKASGTPATGGKTIHNQNDASEGNYVQIASSQVTGTLPAPIKISLINNSGSAKGYNNIYMAVNAFNDPTNFAHFQEGETSIYSGWGTAVTGQTSCSNNGYVTRTFAAGGTDYFKWTLSSALLQDTMGRRFRLLARFNGYTTGTTAIKVKPVIMDDSGLITLDADAEMTLPATQTDLVDLGVLPLPPGGYDPLGAAHVLALAMRSTLASATVNLDYIQLTPTDSYRHIVMLGNQIANGDAVVDDGLENQVYSLEGGVHHYILSPRGAPLMVWPGLTQRIYILHDTGASAPITSTFSVQVSYRQRRLTI